MHLLKLGRRGKRRVIMQCECNVNDRQVWHLHLHLHFAFWRNEPGWRVFKRKRTRRRKDVNRRWTSIVEAIVEQTHVTLALCGLDYPTPRSKTRLALHCRMPRCIRSTSRRPVRCPRHVAWFLVWSLLCFESRKAEIDISCRCSLEGSSLLATRSLTIKRQYYLYTLVWNIPIHTWAWVAVNDRTLIRFFQKLFSPQLLNNSVTLHLSIYLYL